MADTSRRKFLRLLVLAGFLPPNRLFAGEHSGSTDPDKLGQTISVLRDARHGELAAHDHYLAFTTIALEESYPNIAYLFTAFARSEHIHALNCSLLLEQLGTHAERPSIALDLGDTRTNLRLAAKNELQKIEKDYPDILHRLAKDGWEPAQRICRYAWRCHQQHREHIEEIDAYAGWFFSRVAAEIEESPFDFQVCETCGSTLAHPPEGPCTICKQPPDSYRPISRPQA